MNAQAKPNEPSMEEILAFIRRIISDDEAKPAEEAQAPAVEPAPVAEEPPEPVPLDDDVLDLGSEAAFIAPPTPEPEPASPPDDSDFDLDFAQPEPPPVMALPEPEPAPLPPPMPEPVMAARPQPAMDMASLLSDQASSAVTSAFGQLANTVLSNNARTLEDLVKDMLKPMLKAWLDDNLPTMVERLVRAEIERVARGGRG